MTESAVPLTLLVDAILAALLIEAAVLYYRHRTVRDRPGPRRWLPTLLAGAGALVALRLGLAAAPWYAIAGALLVSGLAHLFDLVRFLRR